MSLIFHNHTYLESVAASVDAHLIAQQGNEKSEINKSCLTCTKSSSTFGSESIFIGDICDFDQLTIGSCIRISSLFNLPTKKSNWTGLIKPFGLWNLGNVRLELIYIELSFGHCSTYSHQCARFLINVRLCIRYCDSRNEVACIGRFLNINRCHTVLH